MDPLVAEFIGAVLRWLLTSIGAYLVAHHVITADQSDRFASALIPHLLLWAPVAGGLVWSLWAKYRSRLKFIAAADAPKGASEDSINQAAKTASVKAQAFTGPL
jgi:hypothetical protein